MKFRTSLLVSAALAICLSACSSSGASGTQTLEPVQTTETEPSVSEDRGNESVTVSAEPMAFAVSNTLAEDKEALIADYAGVFEQKTYKDEESGLSITYNLYLPENYDSSASYPMLVFIADSSCVGSDAAVSLTQGRGALVWASKEWQSAYPTIVAVPTYPETILDDHNGYTTTEYVELTKRFIDYMSEEYAVDTSRIYGTGQSMGCMTTLILASEYPDLYAACMFVDGQWDVSALTGLENQTFVYFAAEDDASAWNGAQEVMAMFDRDSVSYKYAQWDGSWSADELSAAAQTLFSNEENQYFISWKTGTIEPKSGGFGSSGNSGNKPSGGFGGPGGGNSSGMSDGPSGGTNSSSYHMASFDYAYNCVAVMEWIFQQRK